VGRVADRFGCVVRTQFRRETATADCGRRRQRPGAQPALGDSRILHGFGVAHEANELAGRAVIGLDGVFADHVRGVFQRFHPPAERLDRRSQLICNHGGHLLEFASRTKSRSQRTMSFPVAIRRG